MDVHEENTRVGSIGNIATRRNEITADDLAIMRHYMFGYDYGIIGKDSFKLECKPETANIITINPGLMFAYGYCGYFDKPSMFYLIPPSVPQYYIFYVELNKSTVPNTVKLAILNNQGSNKVNLRQDRLNSMRTGVFQLPIWQIRISYERVQGTYGQTIKTIVDPIVDLRSYRNQIGRNIEVERITKSVADTAQATTQAASDSSTSVSTTKFTDRAVNTEVNR